MRRVSEKICDNEHDSWFVCNKSVELPNFSPGNPGKCVRIYLTVILLCHTYIGGNKAPTDEVSRKDLTCKITYCSVVNPGGWAPATVLRAVYKKEYPKFLKRLASYVQNQCKDKPIMF